MVKFCPSCGFELGDGSKFCMRCGNQVPEGNEATVPQAAQNPTDYTSSTGAIGFVSAGEGRSFSLKNGRLMNVISGEGFVKEDAVLTDKRLYYSASSGIINKNLREEIVNIEDITGAKIADYKPYSLFVFAFIFFFIGIVLFSTVRNTAWGLSSIVSAVVFIVLFFIMKKSFLRIEYAGGYIGFSVKKYGMQNVREFQRQIYIAKEDMLGK